MDDFFADGVGEITVINGVARLTLVTLETAPGARESGDTKPVPVSKARLAMPVAGLASLVQQAQGLLARMEQAAAQQQPAQQPPGQVRPATTAKQTTGTPPRSPNF